MGADAGWAALHTRPTVLTILISMCVFLPVALALQTHVLDTTSHHVLFFAGSCVVVAGYYISHSALLYFSKSFGRLSRDKRIYAVSNLMKASVLASITPICVYQLGGIVWLDRWDSNTLRNLGCLYAVPDFVSLLLVRRMAATTVIHHMCVVLFNFISIRNDYAQDNVCRLIVVYGAFSTFGYVVYLLLASRFLGVSPVVSRHLSAGALVVYVACCGINWTWQASYLQRHTADHRGHQGRRQLRHVGRPGAQPLAAAERARAQPPAPAGAAERARASQRQRRLDGRRGRRGRHERRR